MTIDEALDALLTSDGLLHAAEELLIAAQDDSLDERLIAILEEGRDDWSGFYATQILSARKSVAAAGPISRLIVSSDDYEGLCEVGMWALVRIGPDALDDVLEVLKEVDRSDGYLEEAMATWGVKDDRIFDALVRLVDHTPPLGASLLGRYRDPRGLPIVNRLFDELPPPDLEFNPDLLEYEWAIEQLGGELSPQQRLKVERYHEVRLARARARDAPPNTHVTDSLPGRNEPCWCGSGKKYKKCHLADDRTS